MRRDGFEPPYPKDQIYSLTFLTTQPTTRFYINAENRNWTHNIHITSVALYQLSYPSFYLTLLLCANTLTNC